MLSLVLLSVLAADISACQKSVRFIGVPVDLGGRRPGSDKAPAKLRSLGIKNRIEAQGFHVEDDGDIYVPQRSEIEAGDHKIRYRDPLYDMNVALSLRIQGAMLNKMFPFPVGGDHSMGIASIGAPALMNRELSKEETGVVYFDNHADIHTLDTTWNGNLHALPLAFLLGLWKDGSPEFQELSGVIKPKNLVYVGLNSLEPAEEEIIRKLGIISFRPADIERLGIERVTRMAIDIASGGKRPIHLSFDLDWMRGDYVPGVGTPEPVGGSPEESMIAVEMIARSGSLKSMDMVELSPPLDRNDQTAKIGIDIVETIFRNLR